VECYADMRCWRGGLEQEGTSRVVEEGVYIRGGAQSYQEGEIVCYGIGGLRSGNGRKAGDEEFAPGWTSYGYRIKYQTFDVVDLLRKGENVVGAYLGEGWYRARIGFEGLSWAVYVS